MNIGDNVAEQIAYQLKISKRARRVSLRVTALGEVQVVVPERLRNKESFAERMVNSHIEWIHKSLKKIKVNRHCPVIVPDSFLYQGTVMRGETRFAVATFELKRRTKELAELSGLQPSRISVRAKKSNWGSCTRKGAIILNRLIYFLPDELRDYVILHELSHLVEFNHSKAFWAKMEEVCPGAKVKQKMIKGYQCES